MDGTVLDAVRRNASFLLFYTSIPQSITRARNFRPVKALGRMVAQTVPRMAAPPVWWETSVPESGERRSAACFVTDTRFLATARDRGRGRNHACVRGRSRSCPGHGFLVGPSVGGSAARPAPGKP